MTTYSSIAIIIPSLNRHQFLLRTIRYYVELDYSLHLFIGDSSEQELKFPSSLQSLLFSSNLNFHYFHLPGLNDRQAISYLADQVNSFCIDYICFHGDDDYFVAETLLECSSFLSRNLDYCSAQGQAYTILLNKVGAYGSLKSISKYWSTPSLRSTSPLKRLSDFADSYFVLQFSLHRTPEFLEACKHYQYVPDRNWGELYHCYYFALQGKSYFVDKLFLVRNVHSAISHGSFARWITSSSFAEGMLYVIEKLSSVYCHTLSDRSLLLMTIERHLYSTYLSKSRQLSSSLVLFSLIGKRFTALFIRLVFFFEFHIPSFPFTRKTFFNSFRNVFKSFTRVT